MKIAILKPDYKIRGGFEIVVDRIIQGLSELGHQVDYLKIDMTKPKYKIGNIEIPVEIYNLNIEFFRYLLHIEEFQNLYLNDYDIVISTQPPSFAVDHNKVIALFYHHLKIYYDLFDVYIECGLERRDIHETATKIIRQIDNYYLTNEKYYLAGSKHVARRLKKFNNINENIIYIFNAGIDDDFYSYNGKIEYIYPICVGRHEFPKRPELFLHSMNHVEGLIGKVIGEGGKTEALKTIDKYLTYIHNYEKNDISDEFLWKKVMFNMEKLDINNLTLKDIKTNTIFTGRISRAQLMNEYSKALCVVCPSYEEDYGLTALEAMSFHKPVIVCNDGGGYLDFIEDGRNGFIVEPTGEAIAEKINYLNQNRDILIRMGENAYEFSRKYNWNNAILFLNSFINNVL